MLMSGKDVVAPAHRYGFAVPAFNISDYGMLCAALSACEEVRSPMIVSIHPAEWELMGDEFLASVKALASASSVPVAIQLDHGATVHQVAAALRLGFTSVMIDGSLLPYEENVGLTQEVVNLAHLVGVSVEGEIGTIGPRDPQDAEALKDIIYTTPSEAAAFVEATGVDYLAIAVGTAHGVYPPGVAPELKLDLISEIDAAVGVPLVLHGGSGAVDEEVSEAVTRGIAKVNISADMKTAYFAKLREVLQDPKHREPHDIYPPALEVVKDVVKHKAGVVRSAGGANYYDYTPAGLQVPQWRGAPVLEH